MASREERIERTLELVADLYKGLANVAEVLRRAPKDISVTGWNVDNAAETANGIIQNLMGMEDAAEIRQDRLQSYVVALTNHLIQARMVLIQYSVQLDDMPGRGAIKGFFVRSALHQTEELLQRVDQFIDEQ
jgi:hypothetical protein